MEIIFNIDLKPGFLSLVVPFNIEILMFPNKTISFQILFVNWYVQKFVTYAKSKLSGMKFCMMIELLNLVQLLIMMIYYQWKFHIYPDIFTIIIMLLIIIVINITSEVRPDTTGIIAAIRLWSHIINIMVSKTVANCK